MSGSHSSDLTINNYSKYVIQRYEKRMSGHSTEGWKLFILNENGQYIQFTSNNGHIDGFYSALGIFYRLKDAKAYAELLEKGEAA